MEEINIKEFFNVIIKKIWLVIGIGIICSFFTFIYSEFIKVPMYEASTTLVLTKTNNNSESIINQNDIILNQKLVATYSELVKSKLVLNNVIKKLDLDLKTQELSKLITVENVENTEMLKISVKYEDKVMAKDITNSIAEVFSSKVASIYEINNVAIVDKAITPKTVCNNTTFRDVILVFLSSSLLVIGVLLVIYYFDDTIKYSEKLEEEINIPLIGKIMLEKRNKKESTTELIVDERPKDLISEAIKSVRTNLSFSSIDSKLKTILMTSTVASEGKSFISANLGTAFAQTGKTVLIVDCDMRKGRQHKIFNISNEKGLSDLIVDDLNNFTDYIKETSVRKLYLLPCGTIPPNPSELLNSEKNKRLIEMLKASFDLVIFDGVPCNGLPDSIIMSTLVDKTIIVSSENITPKKILKDIIKDLEAVKANIAGLVLNKVNMGGSKYYGKYYSYYGESK